MMPKEVAVALIAVSGVIFTQIVTYAISRQSANDLRTNISREIDIIRKLKAGSDEALALERHVTASVNKLITRDERRESISEIIWSSAPLPLIALTVWGLDVWHRHGIPSELQYAVVALYWFLVAIGGLLIGRSA